MDGDFSCLVACHRPELVIYARRLCHARHAAEDVVQDALVRAYRAWAAMDIPEDANQSLVIRSWLYRITYNCFITAYRSARRRQQLHEMNEVEQRATVRSETPEIRYGSEPDFAPAVEEALSILDRDQRKVVLLATRGLAYKEIAAQLGCPIGTVMSRLHRARRQLEQTLGAYAAETYGMRPAPASASAGVDAGRAEPPEEMQPDPHGIDAVMIALDDGQFLAG